MKAITIWQPWASLLASGAKLFETRSWQTDYRGQIAIHAASKRLTRDELSYYAFYMGKETCEELCKEKLAVIGAQRCFINLMENLPYGAVIATANLVDCHKIQLSIGGPSIGGYPGMRGLDGGMYRPSARETKFGDWAFGRYAWDFEDMKLLPEPVPAKGLQRLWEWDGEVA